ncbi:MAG: anaerobic ribonucleoside-triphosphate reductase activating protein [Athalassotoga sp.]|uniref:anaerobic ribonucleoside-triphosphate reductase activating protein n=1 Tax=Athalassotoga sp. TaxID=2022597 RepID=UPI003D008647
MKIGEIRKFSLIDYPEKPSVVLFTSGCNLRCPWCHNWEIAYGDKTSNDKTESVKMILKDLRKHLDAVCVTGGEPTINSDLPELVEFLKLTGYAVKVDSNGTNPKMVRRLLKIVDYFAIDIKARPQKYPLLTGVQNNVWDSVSETVEILRKNDVRYELRMTYVAGLSDMEDIRFFDDFSIHGERIFLTFAQDTEIFKTSEKLPIIESQKITIR